MLYGINPNFTIATLPFTNPFTGMAEQTEANYQAFLSSITPVAWGETGTGSGFSLPGMSALSSLSATQKAVLGYGAIAIGLIFLTRTLQRR